MKLKEPIAELRSKERRIAARTACKSNRKAGKMQSPNRIKLKKR